jgi:preprotein translocase subunit SecA
VSLRTQRLNYFYVAADLTEEWTADDLKTEIIAHLRGALDVMRRIFGEAEQRRLANLRLADLPPVLRGVLNAEPALASALTSAGTLGELTGAEREVAMTALGRFQVAQLLKQLMLQVIGQLWVDYLTSVEALRTSIGLEAYAQRDPLVAYKSRASEMFQELLVNMRAGVVARAFTFRPRAAAEAPVRQPQAPQAAAVAAGNGGTRAVIAPPAAAAATPPPEARNLGRNDACWCGSGKKYKDCHYDKDRAAQAEATPAASGAQPAKETTGEGGGKRRRRRR